MRDVCDQLLPHCVLDILFQKIGGFEWFQILPIIVGFDTTNVSKTQVANWRNLLQVVL